MASGKRVPCICRSTNLVILVICHSPLMSYAWIQRGRSPILAGCDGKASPATYYTLRHAEARAQYWLTVTGKGDSYAWRNMTKKVCYHVGEQSLSQALQDASVKELFWKSAEFFRGFAPGRENSPAQVHIKSAGQEQSPFLGLSYRPTPLEHFINIW